MAEEDSGYDYEIYESGLNWDEQQERIKTKIGLKSTGKIIYSSPYKKQKTPKEIWIYFEGELYKKIHEVKWEIITKNDKRRVLHPDIEVIKQRLSKDFYYYVGNEKRCIEKHYKPNINIEFFGLRPYYYWNPEGIYNFIYSENWRESVKCVNAFKLFYTYFLDIFRTNCRIIERKTRIQLKEKCPGFIYTPKSPISPGICVICGKTLPINKGKGRPQVRCDTETCKYYYDIEKERKSRRINKERIHRKRITLLGGSPEQSQEGYGKKRGKALSTDAFEFGNEIFYDKLNRTKPEKIVDEKGKEITQRLYKIQDSYCGTTLWLPLKRYRDYWNDELVVTQDLKTWLQKPLIYTKKIKTLREIYKDWKYGYKETELIDGVKRRLEYSTDILNNFIFERYKNKSKFKNIKIKEKTGRKIILIFIPKKKRYFW